ncbi:MAG TPA: manno-octulosonate cytidylyltransferase [Opitutales bacterium]|nr:manno-octulosonate cytidylyltransferase [Opitutales bacterium]
MEHPKALIVIPSRYGSTRFAGKPLALLRGKSMLSWVVAVAQQAARSCPGTEVMVATDDERILNHARELDVMAVMTPVSCPTGTDRVHAAIQTLPEDKQPEIIINYQGDAPLASPDYLQAMIQAFHNDASIEAVTPAVRLSWATLDDFRESKKITPFSGTTVVVDAQGRALWFSKNILPGIRKEARNEPLSPVLKHVGLYGYRRAFLNDFVSWPEGVYEKIEGLEQLRILEQRRTLHVLELAGNADELGVDTPEDLARAEAILAKIQ